MIGGALASLVASALATAQAPVHQSDGYSVRAGAGLGVSSNSDLTGAWQAYVGRGSVGLGYQGSASDNFSGATRSAHAILATAILPYGRARGRVAAGVASARLCLTEGEQAGNTTCRSAGAAEVAVSVDVLLSPFFALDVSYFTIPRTDIGQSAMLIGVMVGRFRQ